MSLYQLYIEHCTGGGSPLALPRAQRQSQTHRPSERARAVREPGGRAESHDTNTSVEAQAKMHTATSYLVCNCVFWLASAPSLLHRLLERCATCSRVGMRIQLRLLSEKLPCMSRSW